MIMIIRDQSLTRGCARCVARQQASTATTGARSACPAGHSSEDPSTQVRQLLCKPYVKYVKFICQEQSREFDYSH